MGQHYRVELIDDSGNVYSGSAREHESGSKLTEHSYIGNWYCDTVREMIKDRPMRCAWLGDYSKDNNSIGYKLGEGYLRTKKEFLSHYRKVWKEKGQKEFLPFDRIKHDSSLNPAGYLINHSKHCFISLKNFFEMNSWIEEWTDDKGSRHQETWCMDPLPLLTAVGNGQGGGDYYSTQPDYEKIGTWAYDRIEYTNEKPEDIFETQFAFSDR